MTAPSDAHFKRQYQSHLKHLRLKGLQPKTIEAYARAIRRIGEYFDHQIDDLSEAQLLDYFTDLLETHSWSAVKLDLYGLRFFYTHVLRKPWMDINLVKPPKGQRLPDILTVEEVQRLVQGTYTLSYQVFFFTLYSLGLRLGEGLALHVGDIDAVRQRVCTCGMPRATRIAWCRCRWPPLICCAVSGARIATRSCCFPVAVAVYKRRLRRARRWIAAACSWRCARWWSRAE